MALYQPAATVVHLDVDAGTDSSDTEEPPRRTWKPKHGVAAVLGAAILGCGAVLLRNQPADAPKLTARTLLESPAVHDVASENVLNVHARLPGMTKSKEEVKDLVTRTFRDVSQRMKDMTPETWDALEGTTLSAEQHDGIVHMLKYMKDPRVMQLGLDTAAALREAGSDDQEALKASIIEKLKPRAKEIHSLYEEAVPAHMREVMKAKPGEGLNSILEPAKVKILKTVDGSYYDQFAPEKTVATVDRRLQGNMYAVKSSVTTPAVQQSPYAMLRGGATFPTKQAAPTHSWVQKGVSGPYQKAEEALGVIGAALAEADTLVRMINPLCKVMPGGHDLKVPPMVTSALGLGDFVFQVADCELDAVADGNGVEAVGCPAMSASAGMDAMREPLTLVGLLGDNNDKNGRQGNHEGGKDHQGIFDDSKAGKTLAAALNTNKAGKKSGR
eukprot:TRINITY_DN2452_c0_g1_i2.p1 TRINITY_DN2452_c0_g1~~TRINITY_DN2452_c0_g1_i2.p1  ORF type:complete len:470 (+),score=111.11 TRINITY_DN2452_c0_g1_i2:83-1411(+)